VFFRVRRRKAGLGWIAGRELPVQAPDLALHNPASEQPVNKEKQTTYIIDAPDSGLFFADESCCPEGTRNRIGSEQNKD
jgi:hypothetical protein